MPVSHGLDQSRQLFRTTLYGTVTIDELCELVADLRHDRSHEYPGVVDARSVSAVSFGTRELHKFAELARSAFSHARPAPRAVVVNHVMFFGMARLFAAIAAGWIQIAVFDDVALAEAWVEQFFVDRA
jgi:hypothetical protein